MLDNNLNMKHNTIPITYYGKLSHKDKQWWFAVDVKQDSFGDVDPYRRKTITVYRWPIHKSCVKTGFKENMQVQVTSDGTFAYIQK